MSVSTKQTKRNIPLGFKATKKQKDELQKWGFYFYQQKNVDPESWKTSIDYRET